MGWVYNASLQVEAASQYPLILGICFSLTLLMVVTVCLRLYVRASIGRLAAADYVMLVSMVSTFFLPGCMRRCLKLISD